MGPCSIPRNAVYHQANSVAITGHSSCGVMHLKSCSAIFIPVAVLKVLPARLLRRHPSHPCVLEPKDSSRAEVGRVDSTRTELGQAPTRDKQEAFPPTGSPAR